MPASQPPTETEWQFEAIDLRPVERFLERATVAPPSTARGLRFEPRGTKRLLDTYFDTTDWRIHRAGCVVRIRKDASRFVATMKNLAEANEGLRTRIELSEPIPNSVLPLLPAGPVTERVAALVGGRRPQLVLEVRTRRRPFALILSGAEVGELALDETSVVAPGSKRPLRLRRVELEVQPEHVGALKPFVAELRRECGLQPALLSKFEAGLFATGAAVPGPPDLGSTEIGPESTLGELAFAVLRQDTLAVLAKEPGTRLGEDLEELHQMRVATRRLRAAIGMFLDVLPVRAAQLNEEVRWLAAVLGSVRDLDVQLEQTMEWRSETNDDQAGLAELGEALEDARGRARIVLLASLDSRRYERLIVGLTQMLSLASPRRTALSRSPAVVALPELLSTRQRAARKAARRARKSGVAADFHRLRIRCKRLRYAVEFSEECYSGATKPFSRALSALQNELGKMQDAEVAAERLRAVALSRTTALSLEAVFAIGGIAERYRRESERLLARLGRDVEAVDGTQWRRLETLLRRRREQALAELSRPRLRVSHAPSVPAASSEPTSRADSGLPSPRLELVAQGNGQPVSSPTRPDDSSGPGTSE